MAEWALENGAKSLMDPALGMGSLLRAALAQKTDLEVTAFERDPIILQAYLKTQPARRNIKVLLGDFLSFDTVSRFDAVLMNPPYLRHHDIAYEFDIFANFSKLCSIDVSRLSNIYVLFTLKAIMSLRPGGRASILIPTEWMNANFGHALKTFLIERNVLKEIIYFSHCSEIFDDALTTACVLLLEKELP
jgi:adenine-specific DNA-methyltransferase